MKKLLLFITIFLLFGITNVYAAAEQPSINSVNFTFDIPNPGDEIKNVTTCTATPDNSLNSCTATWIISDPNGSIGDYLTGYSEAKGVFLEDTTYYLLPIVIAKNNYTIKLDNQDLYKFNGENGEQSITMANSSFTYTFNTYKVKIKKDADRSITISNIDIVDKSEKSEAIDEPSYRGLNANLSAKFHNLNDYIKYELTILNETNSYVKLDKNDIKLPKSDYVTYEYEMDNKAISPNSSKTIYVIMKYKNLKEIAQDSCKNYVENNSTSIFYRDNIVENPQTSNYILISLLLVIILISTTIISVKSKNKNIQLFMIILTLSAIGIIPLSTFANDNELQISTSVEIDNNQCTMKVNGECVRTDAGVKWKNWYTSHTDLFNTNELEDGCSYVIPDVLRYYKDGTIEYADGSGNTLVQTKDYDITKQCPEQNSIPAHNLNGRG